MKSSLRRLANLITDETGSLSALDLAWHPEGKWSIAEILEHLSLTYSGTKIAFDRCLQAGKPTARAASANDRLRVFIVTRLGYLPKGREAPAGTRPKGIEPDNVVSDITNKISAMDEAIEECERRFGKNLKLTNHPFLGPMSAVEWRSFHCVHGRLHLRQIRHLRKLIEGKR